LGQSCGNLRIGQPGGITGVELPQQFGQRLRV
jgi:hypothetical protein